MMAGPAYLQSQHHAEWPGELLHSVVAYCFSTSWMLQGATGALKNHSKGEKAATADRTAVHRNHAFNAKINYF
jgi:hypothetical protein